MIIPLKLPLFLTFSGTLPSEIYSIVKIDLHYSYRVSISDRAETDTRTFDELGVRATPLVPCITRDDGCELETAAGLSWNDSVSSFRLGVDRQLIVSETPAVPCVTTYDGCELEVAAGLAWNDTSKCVTMDDGCELANAVGLASDTASPDATEPWLTECWWEVPQSSSRSIGARTSPRCSRPSRHRLPRCCTL